MTKAEKRVAVAKDVLAQIKARKVIATSGLYSEFKIKGEIDREGDAQTILKSEAFVNCHACALGSMLISKARLYDKLAFWEVDSVPYRYLEDLFGNAQLSKIEHAFERCGNPDVYAFGNRYQNDDERLVAIMRNIVRNKGTFKPSTRA